MRSLLIDDDVEPLSPAMKQSDGAQRLNDTTEDDSDGALGECKRGGYGRIFVLKI